MKGNTWLAGYIVLTALLVGGAGFFFVKGKGAYDEQFQGWDRLSSRIERLEKEVPYPNEENESKLEGIVTAYSGEVNALYESLARYQKPLDTAVSDSEFTTQVLSGKVADFLKYAEENKVVIDNKEAFYLAMEDYQSTFPQPAIVPLLDYQLDAIDYLLRMMVDAGVGRLRFVNREDLPAEKEAPAADAPAPAGVVAGQVVQKYPVNVSFVANHQAFQDFVNRLSNDKEYFFTLRVLRVDNSNPNGPELSDASVGPRFINAEGQEAPEELRLEIMSTGPTYEEMVAEFEERGYQLQKSDARIIFGSETVEVFAVIDLVRFLPPDEVEPEVGGTESAEDKGRRRP